MFINKIEPLSRVLKPVEKNFLRDKFHINFEIKSVPDTLFSAILKLQFLIKKLQKRIIVFSFKTPQK